MNIVKYIAYALVLIGALNWGLVGIFEFDLVETVFGDMTIMSRVIYALIGISAFISGLNLYRCKKNKTDNCNSYNSCSM